jgi:hypothetical protein
VGSTRPTKHLFAGLAFHEVLVEPGLWVLGIHDTTVAGWRTCVE